MKPTTADAMIRSWKIARLSSDSALGYPRVNILARCALYGGGVGLPVYRASFLPSERQQDADLVQRIVFRMPDEPKAAFEAYHLGLIDGTKARELSHKDRAIKLGIACRKTYYNRVNQARDFIISSLDYEFDNLHSICRIG